MIVNGQPSAAVLSVPALIGIVLDPDHAAGLLTRASTVSARLPIPAGTVARERNLGAYSGGAVLDSHQLPFVGSRKTPARVAGFALSRTESRKTPTLTAVNVAGFALSSCACVLPEQPSG